eukprot:6193580-Ditylum_brightwellii.AAC.1
MTDKIESKELSEEYCPTKLMVANFYTKPLQGKLFRIFRNRILNLEEDPCTAEHRCQILKQQQDTLQELKSEIAQEPKQDSSAQ